MGTTERSTMDDAANDRLSRIDATQAVQAEQLADIKTQLGDLKTTQAEQGEQLAEIKGILGRLEPMIVKVLENQARLDGRMSEAPTARDFGRLEGRVEALEGRQPVTLAWQQPPQRQAGG
jgi:hypothetical protein